MAEAVDAHGVPFLLWGALASNCQSVHIWPSLAAMFLVVFRNRKRAELHAAAYAEDAARMERLAAAQPGFVSFKSYVAEDGEVIALSEWDSERAARGWAEHQDHRVVQRKGRADYYENYTLFACANPRVHNFERSEP